MSCWQHQCLGAHPNSNTLGCVSATGWPACAGCRSPLSTAVVSHGCCHRLPERPVWLGNNTPRQLTSPLSPLQQQGIPSLIYCAASPHTRNLRHSLEQRSIHYRDLPSAEYRRLKHGFTARSASKNENNITDTLTTALNR